MAFCLLLICYTRTFMKTSELFPKTLLTFLLFWFAAVQSNAQTTVDIISAGDTTWSGSYCGVPQTVQFYLNGNCAGYNPGIDSVTVVIRFGDGQDTTLHTMIYPAQTVNPPQSDYFGVYLQHTYQTTGTYSVQYITTGPDGTADTLININELVIHDSCGNIYGKVYNDFNGNCQFDMGIDTAFTSYPVSLMQGTNLIHMQWTDSNGDYFFNEPSGLYDIVVVAQNGIVPSCPTNGIVSINTTVNPVNDIGLVCNNQMDLRSSLWGTRFRPGFTGWLYPNVQNTSCLPVSGSVTLTLDPLTSYVSSTFPPNTVSGNTLTWNFTNLQQGFTQLNAAYITINTSLSAQIGDTVCFTIDVTPTLNDINTANNTFMFCSPVTNSWDPNEKHVAPLGIGNLGITSPDTRLTYTVHFQNTGSDTAYNVAILDTIDASLNIQSIEFLGSSHNMSPAYQGNQIIKFNFYDIMLPDSTTDPSGSQGWLMYSISPVSGLPLGTQVHNTAYIFFDFNHAIITNTTQNTFDVISTKTQNLMLNAEFQLYPNPASDILYIRSVHQTPFDFRLLDLNGREILHSQSKEGDFKQNISTLSDGYYLIILHTDQGVMRYPFVIRK
jgi:uncharacterized repeat protein (TIGR01451 family)